MWQDRGPLQIPTGRQAAAPQGKKKDFWTDQISTGGGIGGALGGAAAGATIGSVVPGIGTAIGGLIGGIAGGALGSGAGEFTENVITGEEDKFRNVGQEALLGGIFSAPPIRAGKALIGAGKAVASGTGAAGARTAAETALTKPGVIQSLVGKGGQALIGSGDTLAVKQFRLNPSQTSNFKKKFGEDAGAVIRRYGFQSADEIAEKGIKPLQDQFTQTVANIPPVSKSALQETFNQKIATLSKSSASDTRALAQQLKQEADAILKPLGESISPVELNAIKNQFDSLVNYTQQQANPARYGVNKRAADAIRETLQKSDPTGTLKQIGRERQKLTQLSDIALKQEELGRGSLPVGLTQGIGGIAGGVATGNPLGMVGGAIGTAAMNSQAGRRAVAGGADRLSEALLSASQRPVNPTSAGGVIGRLGTVGAAGSIFDQSENSPSNTMNAPISNPMNSDSMDTLYNVVPTAGSIFESNMQPQQLEQPQSQNPYPQQNLLFDIQRDPQNANKYIAYYQSLQEVLGQGAPEPLSQSNQSALASADNAENTLNQLEGLFAQAGGGGGRIGGFVQNLAGQAGLDKNASVYNSLSQASVTQIAKALAGSGAGTVSDADARVIIQALPTLQDSPEEARAKFSALRQRLQAARENTMFYGQGGTSNPLEQALMQQGAF